MIHQDLLWGLIGFISGTVLGITGAGGAIIAIPLMLFLLGLDFRTASALSLIVVVLGSWTNWPSQRRKTSFRAAGVLTLVHIALGPYLLSLKAIVPVIGLKIFFLAILGWAMISLYRDFVSPKVSISSSEPSLLSLLPAGVLLSLVITMTGLGGGVVMVPFMVGVLGFPMDRASSTSLFAIGISCIYLIGVMAVRGEGPWQMMTMTSLVALAVGTLIAAVFVHRFGVTRFRRPVLWFVLIFSAISVLIRE